MRGLLAAAAGFLLLAAPAAAQVTPEDLAQAEAELRQAQHELDAMASRYEEAVAAEARLSADLGRLQEMVILMETELEHVRDLLRQRVAEMYIEGGSPDVSLLLDADSIAELSARLGYLEQVGAADRQLVRRLEVTRRQYEVNVAALARAAEEQAEAVAQLEQMTTELTTALEEASSRYQTLFEQWRQQEQARREAEARRRAEEAARRAATSTTTTTLAVEQPADVGQAPTVPTTTVPTTTAPPTTDPPPSTEGLHCPVAGVSAFVDSWGAPRSGGRSHQGVDMMAARGTPVVAVEAGTVALDNSSLGGISLWLMADAGTHYYYAHLDGWADGLESGQHVEAGDLVGSVGSSGNASAWAPHLHFEQHPGGGQAINPYPLVVSLCR